MTLVEIMVVVAILGLVAVGMLALMDRDERGMLEREARRFAGAVEYATQRAQARHETHGVSAHGGQLRFWVRAADGRWMPIAGDDLLAARALPEPLYAVALVYGGRAVGQDAIVPLRASGRNEPFAFALNSASLSAVISADPLNRVIVTGPAPIQP